MEEKSLSEIKMQLKEIIVSIADFEIDTKNIDNGKDGIKKLGLNSLAVIKMMVEIERKFDIEMDVDEDNADILYSIDELAQYIILAKS